MAPPLRLSSFSLEKYGPFEDRVLEFRRDAALHIVLGRNEAGKSVTLRALTDLFCGFPGRIESEDFRVLRYKSGDLRIGAKLMLADGRNLAFRRRSGRSNTLLGALDSDKVDEARLREFVGTPERKDFENEFGLTAQALRSGGENLLAAGGRLAETLAAGSGQLSALNVVKGALLSEAAELFYAGGRSRKLNAALERYQQAGKELRAAIITGDALKRARDALEAAEAHRTGVNERLTEIERRRNLLMRAQRTRTKLRERAAQRNDLDSFAGLPEIDEATTAAWQAALKRDAQLGKDMAAAQAELAALQAEAARLQPAPDLIAHAEDVTDLLKMQGAADKSEDDLPRRVEAARAGWHKLERAAQALGLAGAEALFERTPRELALTLVRDVLKKSVDIARSREGACTRLEKARARQRALEKSGQPRTDDPAPLLRAFEAFAEVPAVARRLREQEAEISEQMASLDREAQRLAPSVPLDRLLRLALPEPAVIEKEIRRAAALAEAALLLDRESTALAQRIADREKSLQALAREGEVASPEEMRATRIQRDEAVDRLEAEREIDPYERGQRFAGLRRFIASADRQADVLLGGADRAARHAQLLDALAEARADHVALTERQSQNAARLAQFEEDWRSLWATCAIIALAPDLMRDWRAKAANLIERHEALAARRTAFVAATAEFNEMAVALAAFAARLGIAGVEGEAPALLHGRIRDALSAQQKAFAEGRTHEANLANAANEIEEAEKEIAVLDERRASLATDWEDALAAMSLPASSSMAEAEAAERIWTAAIADLRQYRDDEHRVTTIRQDIEAFAARAAELSVRFCPDIAGKTPRRIVELLGKRLENARVAATSLESLATRQSKIESAIEAYRRELSDVRNILTLAAEALAPDEGGLETALERLAKRRASQQAFATLTRDIVSLGDGLPPEQLEIEQQDLDFDSLGAEIAALDAQKALVLNEVGAAAVGEDGARKALAELEAGRDAVGHAIAREEAATELLDIARDWLIRMGAAKLAGIAMERHRQRHQDPVIAAIARMFAQATGGTFAGIVIDYDDGDQPVLKGLRHNGEKVAVEAMSEGTRDQLFLSLRLALLAQRTAEPLPFIGDDLLASFDDERAGHAMDMLTEFGAERQVILFTHHRHLAELGAKRLGDRLDLIELVS